VHKAGRGKYRQAAGAHADEVEDYVTLISAVADQVGRVSKQFKIVPADVILHAVVVHVQRHVAQLDHGVCQTLPITSALSQRK
jgi:hypothetical protein